MFNDSCADTLAEMVQSDDNPLLVIHLKEGLTFETAVVDGEIDDTAQQQYVTAVCEDASRPFRNRFGTECLFVRRAKSEGTWTDVTIRVVVGEDDTGSPIEEIYEVDALVQLGGLE